MSLRRKSSRSGRTVIKSKFPTTQEVARKLKQPGWPLPIIKVFVDELLPEGEKAFRLLRRSGLNYNTWLSSGTVEVTVDGIRFVGLRKIRELISRLKKAQKQNKNK